MTFSHLDRAGALRALAACLDVPPELIETPPAGGNHYAHWQPGDSWRPATPDETPGQLVPGEDDAPEPVDAIDEWDATMINLGYVLCRPCNEWHRSSYGECAINEQGQALDPEGRPW